MRRAVQVIGWREWVSLPALGVPVIKVKGDTGATTSALHAFRMRIRESEDGPRVSFMIHPFQKDSKVAVQAEARLLEKRWVRSSSGHRVLRPVILTPITIGEETFDIELTLANRDEMGFRMLLGRQALRKRFVVDPGRSYVVSRHLKPSKSKGGGA